jgi:hypothetical protein
MIKLGMKQKALPYLIIFFSLIFFIAACTSQLTATMSVVEQTPIAQSTLSVTAPAEAPPPVSDRASISGTLYSYTIKRILPETVFYLTSAVGEDRRSMPPILVGPIDERGDIRGVTDINGQFAMNDIPPGNYFLVAWAPYNWAPAEISEIEQRARLIELVAGQREALGILYLSWP